MPYATVTLPSCGIEIELLWKRSAGDSLYWLLSAVAPREPDMDKRVAASVFFDMLIGMELERATELDAEAMQEACAAAAVDYFANVGRDG